MTALDGILAGAGIANHLKLHYALHPSRLFHKQFCHVLPSRYRALLPTKTIYISNDKTTSIYDKKGSPDPTNAAGRFRFSFATAVLLENNGFNVVKKMDRMQTNQKG